VPRIPTKTHTKLAEADALGKAKGELRGKRLEKPEDKIKDWLKKMADKIDPLEIVAVTGMTYLIKNGIEWTEEIIKNPAPFFRMIAPLTGFAFLLVPDVPEPQQDAISKMMDTPQAEMVQWLLSFVLAYLLVHNFGMIMQAVGSATGNIIGMAKGLLGIGVA